MAKSKYESNVIPMLDRIPKWRRQGLTERQIAKRLMIAYSTFNVYKNQHQELSEALKTGKEELIEDLEDSLYKRAMGYTYKETKEFIEDRDGKIVKKKEIVKKHLPPDTGALAFALKNLDSEHWRDNRMSKVELEEKEVRIKKMKIETENIEKNGGKLSNLLTIISGADELES